MVVIGITVVPPYGGKENTFQDPRWMAETLDGTKLFCQYIPIYDKV